MIGFVFSGIGIGVFDVAIAKLQELKTYERQIIKHLQQIAATQQQVGWVTLFFNFFILILLKYHCYRNI